MTDYFDFDYETFCIEPGVQYPPPVVMSYRFNGGAPALAHANPRFGTALWDVLGACLRTPGLVMRGHNAAFEALVTIAARPDWAGLVAAKIEAGEFVCTMLAERLLRIGQGVRRDGFGLDDCVDRHKLGIKLDKGSWWRTRYGLLWDVPCDAWPADARAYSLGDTCTWELGQAQLAQGTDYYKDLPKQMAYAIALGSASAWGFMTDLETAPNLVRETEDRLEGYRLDLLDPKGRLGVDAEPLLRYEVSKGVPKPVKNTNQARARCEAVYRAMGREPPRGEVSPTMYQKALAAAGLPVPTWEAEKKKKIKITDKMLEEAVEDGADPAALVGNVSVDKDACLLSRDPLLQAYSAYGQADTLLTKARRPLLAAQAGMPVQGQYNTLVGTGRSSSRKGNDPDPGEAWTSYGMQMQNMPRAGQLVGAEEEEESD